MRHIALIFNPGKPQAQIEARHCLRWFKQHQCSAFLFSSSQNKLPACSHALTFGGDGTMLRMSKTLAERAIPVLGVNLGSLGFMAETTPKEVTMILTKLLADKLPIENRMMLALKHQRKTVTTEYGALNDAVIHAGSTGRIITVSAYRNKEFIADYIGDGLIVSTPTGSTAYSLAAQGPIVHPQLSLFILTPISPHTLTQRPLIVSPESTISLSCSSKYATQKPILSIDGQTFIPLTSHDRITISASPHPLRLMSNPNRNYLQILRTKLKWGERGS